MYSLDEIEDDLEDAIRAAFEPAYTVVEQAVPNTKTVLRDSKGKVLSYLSFQFGDLSEGSTHSMVGAEGDDYRIPVYIQAISGDAKKARRIARKAIRTLLGLSFPWSGEIRKRPGGGMWSVVQSDGATEAYMFPASFSILVQYNYDETP